MTEIRFYHLERQGLDQVLPSILMKALEQGRRVVVKTPGDKETERLNEHLWTYNPDAFLPHGSKKDGFAEKQPVWLTDRDENPNGADVLILTQGTDSPDKAGYKLCCEMLDGRDPEQIAMARERWKKYKEGGLEVTYWQQGAKGWEKKSG